jgi:hypothetical protein
LPKQLCQDISHKVHEMLNAHSIPYELELRAGLGHAYSDDYTKTLEKGLAFVLQGLEGEFSILWIENTYP